MNNPSNPQFTDADFVKSSYCTSPPGGCVEIAAKDGVVAVRDTKNPGHMLRFTTAEWEAFIKGVKIGEFDAK